MPNPDSDAVKARIAQVMDIHGLNLGNGRQGVVLQFAHLDQIDPPLVISTWDARRLLCGLLAVLRTLEPDDQHLVALDKKLEEFQDAEIPAWFERGDPGVGPWPALPQPPKSAPRRRKKGK